MFASNFFRMLALIVVLMSWAIQQALSQNVTVTLEPTSQSSIVRYRTTSGGYDFVTHTLHSIGRHDGTNGINSGSTEDTYRQQLPFSLTSIPTDAQIVSATIIGNFTNVASPGLLAKITASSGIGNQQIWTNIASGTTYFSDVSYSNPNLSLTSATFNNAVANALANRIIYLGVMAQTENNDLTYATTNFRLRIVYTPRITVTVRNSFGGGTVKVDGNTVSSGTQFSWLSGSCHTLEATNQPPNNFTTWFNVTTGQPIPGNPITVCPTANTTYQANFSTDVSVTIRNSFGGGFIHVDGQQLSSPVQQAWAIGSSHTLLATNQDFGGYFRVFRDWTALGSTVSQNPLNATATSSGEYIANFNRQFNVSLSSATYVEGGSGGSYKVNGTNVGETWNGRFVENFSQPITLEAVPPSGWVLTRWSDDSEQNPRTIIPTDHTSLHAKYKLHLASNSAAAIENNTQRKIVRDSWGQRHMVYQSGNQIWYSRYADGAWTAEKLLSWTMLPPEVLHRDPSIVFVPGTSEGKDADPEAQQPRIRVAWEWYAADESEHAIMICELNLLGEITYGPTQLLGNWLGQGVQAHPTIAVTPDYIAPFHQPSAYFTLVAWYQSDINALRCSIWWPENATSGAAQLASGVTEFSLAPYSATSSTWHVAYIDNNTVQYRPVSAGFYPQPGSPETIAEGDQSVYLTMPCIVSVHPTAYGDTVGVTWQANYWEFATTAIKYSERLRRSMWTNPTSWLPYTESTYMKPSITSNPSSVNALLVWQTEAPSMYTVRGRPGNWSSVSSLGTGADPTLSVGYSGSATEFLLARGIAAPHVIQQMSLPLGDYDGGDAMLTSVEGRSGRLIFNTGMLHVGVLDARIDGASIGFVPMSDTIRINLSQFEHVLATEPFVGSGLLKLRVFFTAKGRLPNGTTMRLSLRDAASGQLVENLRTFRFGDDTLITLQTSLNHGNRRVRLALSSAGAVQVRGIALERWYLVEDEMQKPSAKGATTQARLWQLPTVFALHPNHPNPFNPTTTIRYDLPEDSHVSLVIYDVLGRKVAEVVNEVQTAGFKSVTWDASAVASGVYLARFTARDENGSVKLSKTMKLVLAK
jgi:hypothetical protein